MLRRLLAGVALAATLALASVVPASASGPAPPGKDTFMLTCEGIGTVTVSLPRSENNNGVGQIVGQRGHLIPVSITFSVIKVATNQVVFTETDAVGHGRAHRNQQTTTCTAVDFEGPASQFLEPGEELSLGVAPTDIIRGTLTAVVIAKL